jgi:glycosyltransferase involved in cell wall biosynthesis
VTKGAHGGRILLVTSSYPRWPGDATTPFVHHLAQDLRALGWDLSVLAPHAPGALRDEVLDGVPVRRFRYLWPESLETICYDGGALVKLRNNRWNLMRIPFLVVAQWGAILCRTARRQVTLVHSHWLLPQGFTVALSAGLWRPHVTTVHGGDVFALQGALARACKRFVIRCADAVTVNSRATQVAVDRLTRAGRERLRIPMGADAQACDPAAVSELRRRFRRGTGPLLVFVGRLVVEKGVGDLLEAIALLRASLPDIAALVVGDGPDRTRFEQQATALGIADRIAFRGWLPSQEVAIHLRAADIFVGPSRPAPDGWVEAQGLTPIEAMFAGVPVVATACGGITDAVRHEQTGLAVRPQAPEEIAAAVQRLASDPALATRLAAAARSLALGEYTREICARRFSALYTRLTGIDPARLGAAALEEVKIGK